MVGQEIWYSLYLLGLHLELLLLAVHVLDGAVEVADLDVVLVHCDLKLLNHLYIYVDR